jgi:preprotein translocase subunit SecD
MEMRRDGKLVSSSVIREPILGGSLQISGRFSVDQATEIASQLPAGSKIEVEAAVAH